MVSYNYLGYGVTDENGIAKLDHNAQGQEISHSYTGVGAGEIDVVASLDNPVVEGSIVSDTFNVIDAIFKDMGTSTEYGAWTNWTNYEPKLVRTDYCAMSVDTGKENARMYKQIDASSNDIAIEFDVKQVTSSASNVWATLRDNQPSVKGNVDMTRFSSYGGAINEWVHFKFVVTPTNVKVYVNNNTTPYIYNSSGVTRLYFQIDSSTSELDYKNFVIYPV